MTNPAEKASQLPIVLAFLNCIFACQNLPTDSVETTSMPFRGITLVDWSANGYERASSDEAIAAIATTGANQLTIIVTAYQSQRNSAELTIDPQRTPSHSAVRHAATRAKTRGLTVALKPHVDLDDGSWRGQITPPNPDTWFRSYQSFVLPLAELAQSVGATHFIAGTELAGTLRHETLWRETLTKMRTRFSGELGYAASWDEAGLVPFWKSLDFVGVNAFFPLTVRDDPGRFEILSGWQPWLQRLERLHRQTDRPIILSEIGYRSIDGAGMSPFDFARQARVDLQEQADLYWAALEATKNNPWIVGMYWWNWPADGSGGSQNTDFSPAQKPAEDVLRRSWSP